MAIIVRLFEPVNKRQILNIIGKWISKYQIDIINNWIAIFQYFCYIIRINRVVLKRAINKVGIVLCTIVSHKTIEGKLIEKHGKNLHNWEL